MNRRGFLSGILAAGALFGAGVRLPRLEDDGVTLNNVAHPINPYFTDPNAWYIKTDAPDGLKLSEASIEEMLIELRAYRDVDGVPLVIHPTHFVAKYRWSDPYAFSKGRI